jgi:hypothetical protein
MLTAPIGPGIQRPTHNGAAVGWECPRCHATFAPWVASCQHCAPAPLGLRDRMDRAAKPTPSIPGPFPLVEGAGTDASGH